MHSALQSSSTVAVHRPIAMRTWLVNQESLFEVLPVCRHEHIHKPA